MVRFRLVLVAVIGLLASSCFAADEPEPLQLSPAQRQLLEQVRDAYDKLKSIELSGTIAARLDIAGQQKSHVDTFTAVYQSPNLFRQEIKDDIVTGGTGEKLYAFQSAQNLFVLKDAPKDRVAIKELPDPINRLLAMQNPSLALALSPDAGAQVIADATAIASAELSIEGKSLPALTVTLPVGNLTYGFDPQTHLLRRAILDEKAYLEKVGQSNAKSALITFDYTRSTVDGPTRKEQFAWTPPSSARDIATLAGTQGEENPAAKLEGTAAPDFTLADLAGKEVKLSGMKGSVVIVDFWATRCGPCVQSLPHLNELYESKKADGLKVVAVSVDEDKTKVPPFVTAKQLHFTVVIDTEQVRAAEKYFVNGIPQTVVIGKNGKVRKVFVGFGPDSADKLKAEVEAAMKE